jgi:hypothetical protein
LEAALGKTVPTAPVWASKVTVPVVALRADVATKPIVYVAVEPAVEGDTETDTELTELAAATPTPSTGVNSPARIAPVPNRTRERRNEGSRARKACERGRKDHRAD